MMLAVMTGCLIASLGAVISALFVLKRGNKSREHIRALYPCVAAVLPGAAWSFEVLVRRAATGQLVLYPSLAALWYISLLGGPIAIVYSLAVLPWGRASFGFNVARCLHAVAWIGGASIGLISAAYA